MAQHYRVGRLSQEIQREVNDILTKRVRDPRVKIFRHLKTASWLVIPRSLFKGRIPSIFYLSFLKKEARKFFQLLFIYT